MKKDFLYYDPRLVEESVFAALKNCSELEKFHAARASIYEIASVQQREREFDRLYQVWFQRLRLSTAIEQAIAEQPTLCSETRSCVVLRALGKKQEGTELFVSSAQGLSNREKRTVRLLLRSESLLDPPTLLTFLRHELFHVVDMLDPRFGYEPALPVIEGGPAHDALLRERYRTLWDISIAGRMVKRGWLPESERALHHTGFALAFPALGNDRERIFRRFFDEDSHTHAAFVAFALNPQAVAGSAPNSRQVGSRCALCGFPTHAFEPHPDSLDHATVAAILQDFPRWQPADGLCIQCADLYRAIRLSIAAAKLLPGAQL